jgi:hypothetical protein
MDGANRSEEVRAFAGQLREAVDDDLRAVEALLRELGSAPSRGREAAIVIGERLGRLKLNGRTFRFSPLSTVVELEGCRLLLESAADLWSGLQPLALGPPDAELRKTRVAQLREAAEALRLEALEQVTRLPVGEPRST